jgi:uncharacterized Fe-S cluster-containing radical SAM superfamily protein
MALVADQFPDSAQPETEHRKFRHPEVTATGERRAEVALRELSTLWFNTGTICNLECGHCYIESSPSNDRLIYLTLSEVQRFVDELEVDGWPTDEIGFTGGEPFMNPDFIGMLECVLSRGFKALVLTNGMRPMMKQSAPLLELQQRYGENLLIRISLDHYDPKLHDAERGRHAWQRTLPGLNWLATHGFNLQVAGRTCWPENETELRAGFGKLFDDFNLAIDAIDPAALILFPEMDPTRDVPEITEACWTILDVDPGSMMCASSRMVEHRKGEANACVVPCTLLAYDKQFDMGQTLGEANRSVKLNHPYCAEFCVLGGGSCSVHE